MPTRRFAAFGIFPPTSLRWGAEPPKPPPFHAVQVINLVGNCYESRARSRLRSNGPSQCIRRARFATRLLHSSQFTMGGYAPHTPEIVVIRLRRRCYPYYARDASASCINRKTALP